MIISRLIYPNENLSFKLPSIHWQMPYGKRDAEKRAGMIVNDEKDYKDFFIAAKQNYFRIIFDGLGLKERKDCFSNPISLIKLFK